MSLPLERQTAASRWGQLQSSRQAYIDRARDCARVTIPSMFPPEGSNGTTILPTPFQAFGARVLNNLAAKILLVLLPPNGSFFRLIVTDPASITQLQQNQDMATAIDTALVAVENVVQNEIETQGLRVPVFEAVKQLILGGNVLVYVLPKGGMRVFRLDKYVCKRAPNGDVVDIVVKEQLDRRTLDPVIRKMLEEEGDDDIVGKEDDKKQDQPIDLYTRIQRVQNHWEIFQEVCGKVVPGSEGTYPLDKSPWMALRYARVDGEDYGRGFCEEYIGDLISLEELSKAIVEGSAAAAKVIFLRKVNGATKKQVLAEARSGDIVDGDPADVGVLQMEKQADFQIAQSTINDIKQELGLAFLLNTSIQRNGERVTAEEIRYMAQELENAQGGVYAILSQEFQLPLVNRLMSQLQKANKLPPLPKNVVRPAIITGIEALGRGHDLAKLDAFIQGLQQTLGPSGVQYINVNEYLARRANALGVEIKGLVKTPQQLQAEQQQAQAQQMMQQATGPGVNAMGGLAKEAMKAHGGLGNNHPGNSNGATPSGPAPTPAS